jgi:hypothetical protein
MTKSKNGTYKIDITKRQCKFIGSFCMVKIDENVQGVILYCTTRVLL